MMIQLPILLVALVFVPQQERSTYELKRNSKRISSVYAEVLAVEDGRVQLRGKVRGEEREGWVPIEAFKDNSALRLLGKGVKAGDPETNLRVARYAVTIGRLAEAQKALTDAREAAGGKDLDPELVNKVMEMSADEFERRFHENLYNGKVEAARKDLARILSDYPASRAARNKDRLEQLLERKQAKLAEEERMRAAEEASARMAKAREKTVKPIQSALDKGIAAEQNGLKVSQHFNKAKPQFLRAVRYFNSTESKIDYQLKRTQDPELTKILGELRKTSITRKKSALLSLGSLSVTRGQFNNAMGYVNAILVDFPGDRDALDLRGRIETAANEQRGYGVIGW